MATSAGLQQEYTMTTSKSDQGLEHETSEMAADLESLTKDTSAHASALGGMESAYVKHPQFEIVAQDVPMIDKIFDDDDQHFVCPALDGEKEMHSWQGSDDVSMEAERLFNRDSELHGKRSSSPTGMTKRENQSNLQSTSKNASLPQCKLDHPIAGVENIDKFNDTDSNAEIIQEFVETALGTHEKDEIDSVMEPKEVLVEDVEPLLAKEERIHDGATQDGIIVQEVGAMQDGIIVQEVEVECAIVASSMQVHGVDSKQVERRSDDQLPLMDGEVVTEIHGGGPLMDNEEELFESAPEQVEQDGPNKQGEEPTKGHQEIVHECCVPESDNRKTEKRVDGVTNDWIEGPFREEKEQDKELEWQVEKHANETFKGAHDGHQELVVETCSVQEDTEKKQEKQDIMYSSSAAELETPPTLMAEHVHACNHLDEEKEGEKVLEGVARPGENQEPTFSSTEDEALPEKLDGDKVPKEVSMGELEGDVLNAEDSDGERDEVANRKSPSAHAGEMLSRKKLNKAHKEGTVFGIGDMVWAKVRSHPWWPAQIFGPSDASKAARKLKKPGRALVAFYGDCTFAWLEQSQMIAFRPNFEEKVTQTTMRSFCMAVGEALEEFCRRSELGLRCEHCKGPLLHSSTSMFPEANTGIREGVRLDNYKDMSTSAQMFQPEKVLEFAKGVACSPLSSWSSTLCLSELRGHAYGVRTCMVALGADAGAPILHTTIRRRVSKPKRSYISLNDDKEPVVGGKQVKKQKRGKGQSSAGKREPSDTAMDGDETLLVLAGNKFSKSTNKTGGGRSGSLSKVHRHTIGGEPGTPKRGESKVEDASIHMAPGLDGKVLSARGMGTRGMKKLFVVSETGSWHVSETKAQATKDVPMRKDDYDKEVAEKATSKKFVKVGDSIKKVASELTGIAPSKHAGELPAKSTKPGPKRQVQVLASKLQASPLKKEKTGFKIRTGDTVAIDSLKKAGGAASKTDNPPRKGNQVDEAKAQPHCQNVPHKSQKSRVQELALAARKRKSELEHETAIKIPKVTSSLGGQHQAKEVSKTTEKKPSGRRSSFEKGSAQYLRRQETKGSDECLDEKLSSHLPLGLFMKFPADCPLPSESQLISMFLPFGPLQTSSARVYKDLSSAQVVFKHGRDAESALKHAKKNALFGPIAVTYRLHRLLHSVRTDSKMKLTPSGKASVYSESKPPSVEEKEGQPPSSEANRQDVEVGAAVAMPIQSDGMADMPTSDIQDKMMNLLRQVSVIVNPSPSDGT